MADQELWLVFRAALAAALHVKGLKQYELAKLVGVTPSSVHGWLHERSIPSGEKLTAVARVLELRPEDLVPSSARTVPTRGKDAGAYVTGGRVVLDELDVLLRDLRTRWEKQQADGAKGARESSDAVSRVERAKEASARRRRSKGS